MGSSWQSSSSELELWVTLVKKIIAVVGTETWISGYGTNQECITWMEKYTHDKIGKNTPRCRWMWMEMKSYVRLVCIKKSKQLMYIDLWNYPNARILLDNKKVFLLWIMKSWLKCTLSNWLEKFSALHSYEKILWCYAKDIPRSPWSSTERNSHKKETNAIFFLMSSLSDLYAFSSELCKEKLH